MASYHKLHFSNLGFFLVKQNGLGYSNDLIYKGDAPLWLGDRATAVYSDVVPGFAFRYDIKGASRVTTSMIVKVASENYISENWKRYGHKYHVGAELYITGSGNLFLRALTLRSNYQDYELSAYQMPERDDKFPYHIKSNYTSTVPTSTVLVPDTWYWVDLIVTMGMSPKEYKNPFTGVIELYGWGTVSARLKINGADVVTGTGVTSLVLPHERVLYLPDGKTLGKPMTQFGGVEFGNSFFADVRILMRD